MKEATLRRISQLGIGLVVGGLLSLGGGGVAYAVGASPGPTGTAIGLGVIAPTWGYLVAHVHRTARATDKGIRIGGSPRRARRFACWIDTGGLLLVARSGEEHRFPWHEHDRLLDGSPDHSHSGGWRLHIVPPESHGRSVTPSTNWIVVVPPGPDLAIHPPPLAIPGYQWFRIAGGRTILSSGGALEPLCAYLAATPAARRGLSDRGRTAATLDDAYRAELAKPRPPVAPEISGVERMYDAIAAVLAGHRFFERRPIRGEIPPRIEDVVAEVLPYLLDIERTQADLDHIATVVDRHLDVAPWPFDLLLGPSEPR